MGLIPELARSPGEWNGNPFHYSCLGNPMDRGVWQDTVHGVTKSRTWLSEHQCSENCRLTEPALNETLFCTLTHQIAKSPPSLPHFWSGYWSGKNNIHRELFWPSKQSHKVLLATQPLLGSDVRNCCKIGVSWDLLLLWFLFWIISFCEFFSILLLHILFLS